MTIRLASSPTQAGFREEYHSRCWAETVALRRRQDNNNFVAEFSLRRRIHWRTTIAILWVAACFSGISIPTAMSPVFGEDDLSRRKAQWRAQGTEISTARIRLMHRNGIAREDSPSWDEVQKRLARLMAQDLSGDDVTNELTELVVAIKGPRKPPGDSAWLTLKIVQSHDSKRNQYVLDGERLSELAIHDGSSTRYFPNFSEVVIDAGATPQGRYGVNYIRPTPAAALPWVPVDSSLSGVVAYEHRLTDGPTMRMLVDEEKNFLLRLDVSDVESKVRGGLTAYPGNVMAPSWGINVSRGRDDRIRIVEAFIVESAEFNLPLSDEDFSVIVPAKTRVIDRRDP